MPRQLDQLPADTTTLARKVAALEREVKELRAARRLSSATIGLVQTAAAGSRVALNQSTKSVQVYGDDGTTLLAELGPQDADGGGGLWTRGLQTPHNMSASLGSGQLTFRPVDNGLVAVSASMSYDTDAYQYSDLILTSGAVNKTDHRAILTLESLFDGTAHVSVQGENSAPCTFDVLGIFSASNIAYGSVSITPSAANTPTSVNVTGLSVKGASFFALATPATAVPGSQVTGVGATNPTATGATIWLTRTNTTATTVNWMVLGI
ncbi:hypothetical protein [Streptomyces griseofuscus]|uniref:Uncharacterized protein n=1 Tax=Streptomyces griseofuscus TaxID=146922 RepID=A0A3R8QCQ5_9ACTN|nr:hypothetical protein [Streptomyces griseofuscus]RRQ81572.1 hypothetical protein CQW44_30700 [Streptomyces griseofuscus]